MVARRMILLGAALVTALAGPPLAPPGFFPGAFPGGELRAQTVRGTLAPVRSLRPLRRPASEEALIAPPPARPAEALPLAQGPAPAVRIPPEPPSMPAPEAAWPEESEVTPGYVPLSVAAAETAAETATPSRPHVPAPPPRPARIAAAAEVHLPEVLPEEIDPRAVARSLTPRARTAAAERRFRAAAARAPGAGQTQATPVAVTQPPAAAGPSGPGLCGDPALQGRRLARITSSVQGCGIAEPVSLTHAHGVRLSTPATLNCDAARATGRWVRDVMQPAFGRQGGGVTEIRVAAHYACRPRNNQRGARVSEHGRGSAIDISGFRLANGDQVVILRDYRRGSYSNALQRMRAGACGIFRTILGPGSDRFHEDHFHFDMAQHRGGGAYCR